MSARVEFFDESMHWKLSYCAKRGEVYLVQDGAENDSSVIALTLTQLPRLANALLALHAHAAKIDFEGPCEVGRCAPNALPFPSEVLQVRVEPSGSPDEPRLDLVQSMPPREPQRISVSIAQVEQLCAQLRAGRDAHWSASAGKAVRDLARGAAEPVVPR
jgi:hypothetical protein